VNMATRPFSSSWPLYCIESVLSVCGILPAICNKSCHPRRESVRTGSWTSTPRGKSAPRVGVSSTVFGVEAFRPRVRCTASRVSGASAGPCPLSAAGPATRGSHHRHLQRADQN
jgi:hypothetical protein